MSETPWLFIVGGPNGSGKSTLLGEGFADRVIAAYSGKAPAEVLDPDQIAARLRQAGAPSADFRGMADVRSRLRAALAEDRSVAIETVVLSHAHRLAIMDAQSRGYRTCFVYVFLRKAEMNIDRVALRGLLGGHVVQPDLIRARRQRSLERFAAFADACEFAIILDNSADGLSDTGDMLLADKSPAEGWAVHADLANAPPEISVYLRARLVT